MTEGEGEGEGPLRTHALALDLSPAGGREVEIKNPTARHLMRAKRREAQ
jgi:hypothetical protein